MALTEHEIQAARSAKYFSPHGWGTVKLGL